MCVRACLCVRACDAHVCAGVGLDGGWVDSCVNIVCTARVNAGRQERKKERAVSAVEAISKGVENIIVYNN